jgi:DNA-binding transcriptional regulator GbsR (MarR family)
MNKQNNGERPMPNDEEIASLLEQLDIPRGSARIIARLLASDPPVLSFGELAETLGMSKAAVSVALSYLEALEAVHYTTVPGTRRRLVHLDPRALVRSLQRRMAVLRKFADSLQALAGEQGDTEHARVVRSLADLYHELDVSVISIVHSWEEETHETVRRDREARAGAYPLHK